MPLPKSPLPTNPAEEYAKLRSGFIAHLDTLKAFYTAEYKESSPQDRPFRIFEDYLDNAFPKAAPEKEDAFRNKMRQLQEAIKLMEYLIALQKAALPYKNQAPHKEWYAAGLDIWLQGNGLAQHLLHQSLSTKYSSYIAFGLSEYSEHSAQLASLSKALTLAVEVLSPKDKASVLHSAWALIKATGEMQACMDHSAFKAPPQGNRFLRGLVGALSFLAGLAVFGVAVVLAVTLTPLGIGFLPAIPLFFLSAWLLHHGVAEVVDATKKLEPYTAPLDKDEQALAHSGSDTGKALNALARLGVFSNTTPTPTPDAASKSQTPSP